MKTYFKRGKHILTGEEIDKARIELVDLVTRQQETEDEKKSRMAVYTDKLKGFKDKINKITGDINNGYVFKEIECERVMDFTNKIVLFKSLEDGLVLDSYPMSESDYQMQVPGVDEEVVASGIIEVKIDTDNPFDKEPEIKVQ